jgi:precorrin-6B methylase 2
MRSIRPITSFVLLLGLLSAACTGQAPQSDVPYVPTPEHVVERMLKMARVGENDIVYDLGSGDGRIAIAAVRDFRAQRALGVDIDAGLVRESIENAQRAGVADRVEFRQQNLFETDLSEPTVITLYLLPSVNLRLKPTLLSLKPGTRIVSHAFDMGDWQADEQSVVQEGGYYQVFYWVVPAQVAGTWEWKAQTPAGEQPIKLELHQRFQELSGAAQVGDQEYELAEASLIGEVISLTLRPKTQADGATLSFQGKVDGDRIVGHVRSGDDRVREAPAWSAQRTRKAEPDFGHRHEGMDRDDGMME